MYRYPSGLTCNASPLRVKLYEALVPPLCGGALLVGFFGYPDLSVFPAAEPAHVILA